MSKTLETPAPASRSDADKPLVVTDAHHAPVIFFDGAPNFGNNNGIVNITLAVAKHTLSAGSIKVEVSVAAYLRCNIPAAIDLRDALNNALLIGAPVQGEAN